MNSSRQVRLQSKVTASVMGSNETELNSVSQLADETLAIEGQSKAITDPENTSAEQPRRGDAKQEGTQERARQLLPWGHRVEVVTLGAVIVLVWGLLTLPIVFYYLPNDTVIGRSTCEQTNSTRYNGTVCRKHLQLCLNTPGAGDIYVSLTVDEQVEAEESAMLIEVGLDRFQASDECKQAALPFVCLYLFGLCDDNGTLHSPSAMDCLLISTELCVEEWAAGKNLGLPLPECSTLPEQSSVICLANTTTSPPTSPPASTTPTASIPSGTSTSTSVAMAMNCIVQCRDSFYCTINNTCRPRCGSWEQHSHAVIVAIDVVVIISASVGVIAGVVVFITTCIQRRQLLAFPAIIVQYMTAILVILASVVLISYFDRTGLFCSSIDLQISIDNTTPFCTFAGVLFYYTILNLAIWWFFHVAILFWKVQFPFHARRFKLDGRMKYLHIAMVIMALLIPVIPVVAETVAGRFAITRFPPILCTGTSSKVTFYALVLPITILLQIGITLLIVIFWVIHKHHGLFWEKMSSNQPIKIGTAERKILIVFCYYVLLEVIAVTFFTLTRRNLQDFIRNVLLYFACEANGMDSSCDQIRSRLEGLGNPELGALSYILLGLFSAVNLIYVINAKELSKCCDRK